MPRISEKITLGVTDYKAVRPQNGQTPAQFRQQDVTFAEARDLNLGVQITKTANRSTRRSTSSLVVPKFSTDGVLLHTDRIDIKTRFDTSTTDTEIESILAEVAALLRSEEFSSLAKGNEQF